ncbi:hypothetical protein KDK77_06425, partial [bacterium]|nr:hypothetical protein [bacterium]
KKDVYSVTKLFSICFFIYAVIIAGTSYANYSITPSRLEGELTAGNTHSGVFKIQNNYPMSIKVKITWKDFTIDPLAPDWLEITAEPVEIPSNVTVAVPYTITLPENASGGYFARIYFAQLADETVGNTFVVRYNIPIYVSIPDTQKYGFTMNSIEWENTREFRCSYIVENKSNVHCRVAGNITLSSTDNTTVHIMAINQSRRPLMPEQGATYYSILDDRSKLADGTYKAVINAHLEEKTDLVWTESVTFQIKDGAVIKQPEPKDND